MWCSALASIFGPTTPYGMWQWMERGGRLGLRYEQMPLDFWTEIATRKEPPALT